MSENLLEGSLPNIDPEDLSRIMALKVSEMGPEDFQSLILALRADRMRFISDEQLQKKRKTSALNKAVKVKVAPTKVLLDSVVAGLIGETIP